MTVRNYLKSKQFKKEYKCCNYCKHYDAMEGACLLTKKIVNYLDGYCKKYKEDDLVKDIERR